MSREFKRSILKILLLIPMVFLIPNIGLGGEPPPAGSLPVLPAYMGNLTVEWQSTNTTCSSPFWTPDLPPGPGPLPCGEVIFYGKLDCAEKKCKDIIITKKKPITLCNNIGQICQPIPIAQMDFLSLDPADISLRGGGFFTWTFPLAGPGTYFSATSVNNLSYQSETLFTVDVVVMQFK